MKKGQLKIQQMAFMLIAVTIFFAIVGMVVLVIRITSLQGEADLIEQQNARLLITKLANSPEFSCGEAFGTLKTNCIDKDKAMIVSQNLENYEDFWGELGIEIRTIYPSREETLCTMQNYPDCNYIKLGGENISGDFSNFVALCRKARGENIAENDCELGKVYVNYEEIN